MRHRMQASIAAGCSPPPQLKESAIFLASREGRDQSRPQIEFRARHLKLRCVKMSLDARGRILGSQQP